MVKNSEVAGLAYVYQDYRTNLSKIMIMFSLGHFLNVLLVGCAVFCLNKEKNLIQPLPSVMLDISFLIQHFCFITISVQSRISMSFS